MLERFLNSLWLVFVLSMLILVIIMGGALVVSHSDEIHGVEQNVAYNLQLVIGGLPLYSDPELPPYNIVQYMPAYYALIDNLASVFRIEASDIQGIYLLGRTVAYIFGLGLALLVWFSSLRFGLDKRAAFGVLLLGVLLPMPWFVLVRPDSMMSFFDFLGMVLFMIYMGNKQSSPLLLFSIGFALAIAFFAKQTAVLPISLILVFPFYKHAIKDRLFILLGLALGLGLMVLLLRDYFSLFPLEGNPFYMNVVEGVTNKINLVLSNQLLYNIYFNRLRPFFLFPLVLTVFIGADFLRQASQIEGSKLKALWNVLKKEDPIFIFLVMGFWWLTLIALVMGFKDGAAINYMIESMLMAVLLIGYYIRNKPLSMEWFKRLDAKIAAALAFMVISFSITADFVVRNSVDIVKETPREEWQETLGILETEFAAHPESAFIYFPKDVFDRWLNFYFYENVWFTSREIYGQAFFDISSLQGYLDDGSLRLFITDKIEFPEEVFGYRNFQEYFELWQETETHLIYRNRNSE